MNESQRAEALRLADALRDEKPDADLQAAALLRALAVEPAIEQALAEALRLADALDKCISNAELSVLGNDAAALLRTLAAEPNYAQQLGECTGAIQTLEREVAYWKAKAGPQGEPAPDAQPVAWIQPDHLQKARVAPFLCRVEPTKRMSDFVPIYLHPAHTQTPLTVDELIFLAAPYKKGHITLDEYSRSIERAHGIGVKL